MTDSIRVIAAGVADMDANSVTFKKAEGCLSPTSVPDGWAAMSDGESSAGSDGGACLPFLQQSAVDSIPAVLLLHLGRFQQA
jgi:hypothetical protein